MDHGLQAMFGLPQELGGASPQPMLVARPGENHVVRATDDGRPNTNRTSAEIEGDHRQRQASQEIEGVPGRDCWRGTTHAIMWLKELLPVSLRLTYGMRNDKAKEIRR